MQLKILNHHLPQRSCGNQQRWTLQVVAFRLLVLCSLEIVSDGVAADSREVRITALVSISKVSIQHLYHVAFTNHIFLVLVISWRLSRISNFSINLSREPVTHAWLPSISISS
jgi:hypothetical protein